MDLVALSVFLHPDNNNNKVSQEAFGDVWTFELQVVGRIAPI